MPDYTHAITQLRWLIREDFYDRNRGVRTVLDLDMNERPERVMWWQSRMGREDMARVRSYIAAVRALEAAAKPRTCLHCRHFQMAPECKTWNTEPEDFRYGRCIVRLGDDVDICTNREGHVEEVAIMRTSFGCGAFEEKGGDDE